VDISFETPGRVAAVRILIQQYGVAQSSTPAELNLDFERSIESPGSQIPKNTAMLRNQHERHSEGV